MIITHSMRYSSHSRRRGLTLLDMLISIPLVGIALVAALNTVGASKASQFKVNNMRQGHLLAQELMSEILQQDYTDVDMAQTTRDTLMTTGSVMYTLGPDNFPGRDELATGDRSLFNDVDDYDGWVASPPQDQDGTTQAVMIGWQRMVSVDFVKMNNLTTTFVWDYGAKRITVSVTYNNVPAAELVAIQTIGLPWLEACCFSGGLCDDLRTEACAVQGGTAQGPETKCANTACATGPSVLLVVNDVAAVDAQESVRQALMESWDFSVSLISASAPQADFDTAVTTVDVAYVSETILSSDLNTKLVTAPIGVINEEGQLIDDFGFVSGTSFAYSTTAASVTDNTHYITSPFALGPITLSTSAQPHIFSDIGLGGGVQVLATIFSDKASLHAVEAGGLLAGGGTASGRRVKMIWGNTGYDITTLTLDGQTIMKRAIEWGAQNPAVCGNGPCEEGEDSCTCAADCGVPAAFEQPGSTCDDGLDNDCNGNADCADPNCLADPACLVCGNGVCELGEDCITCVTDCPSKLIGFKPNRYCCGNGIAESAEGDGSICDGNY